MNYKKIQKTLNELDELLTEILIKDNAIKLAKEWNERNSFAELHVDVQELIDERKELELEFNQLKKQL